MKCFCYWPPKWPPWRHVQTSNIALIFAQRNRFKTRVLQICEDLNSWVRVYWTKKRNFFPNPSMTLVPAQAAQAQYESRCGCVIFKMAVIIKDLYGNSGNRFENTNTRMNFQWNTLYLIYLVSSCFLCGYFPDQLRFKRFPLSRVSKVDSTDVPLS